MQRQMKYFPKRSKCNYSFCNIFYVIGSLISVFKKIIAKELEISVIWSISLYRNAFFCHHHYFHHFVVRIPCLFVINCVKIVENLIE